MRFRKGRVQPHALAVPARPKDRRVRRSHEAVCGCRIISARIAMTEDDVMNELEREPFAPLRLHLVSGETLHIMGPNAAHPLSNTLLVLRNPTMGTATRAEGFDLVAYYNIERIERLH